MLRRSICLSTLAVSVMLFAAAAAAHESDTPAVDSKVDTAEFFQSLYAWQKEPVKRKATHVVVVPAPLAANEVSATDFAPYYTALRTWQNESVGDMATAAFEQADCGCASAGGCDCGCATGGDCGCATGGDCGCATGCDSGCDCASIACDCGCGDCGTCGTCCCPPLWKASAAFLALARDLRNAPIVTNAAGATVVSSGQFDTGYEPGVEFSLRGPLGDHDVQIRYIHSDSFNEAYNRTALATDSMLSGLGFGPGGFNVPWSYQSRLYNLELNFLRAIPESNFEVFAGLAYLRYEEAINFPFLGGVSNSLETENDLIGLQLGGNALLYGTDQFSLEATGRAGVFYARSKSELDLTGTYPAPSRNNRDNADNVAFVGEVGVLANYLLFGNTSIEASYHALWINGAALAGDQFSTTDGAVLGGGPGFSMQLNQGEIFFHGFNLGIATRW